MKEDAMLKNIKKLFEGKHDPTLEEKTNLCEYCQRKRATKEFVGFIRPFDFRKTKVCSNCYSFLADNNQKNWEQTGTFYNASINAEQNKITQANLELIKQCLRDVFSEIFLLNRPNQHPQ